MPKPQRRLAEESATFRRELANWFQKNRRSLPWREKPSLYSTVVSEFMLQQTQIKTALPYFESWLKKFPDFEILAAASEAAVLKAWEGLGYYSRARNLHRLAKAVAVRRSPPRTAEEWRELPGVGPYTAAAISSIACGEAEACVDGNVVRVLARLTGDATEFESTTAAAEHFRTLAGALLDPKKPGAHNEAMMELGATLCTKSTPACERCPVRSLCRGFEKGIASTLPKISRAPTQTVRVDRAIVIRSGKLLLWENAAKSRRLAGIYEIPDASKLGLSARIFLEKAPLFVGRRSITHHRIEERFFTLNETSLPAEPSLKWIRFSDLEKVSLSGPHRRWLATILSKAEERAEAQLETR